MRSILALFVPWLLAAGAHAQPAWPGQDWSTSLPEAHGMDSKSLAALVAFGRAAQMDSLVVTRHGVVVTEAYYAPFQPGMPHAVNSATKAVIGALVGIAIARGELPPPQTPVATLLPGGQWPGKEGVTLQHLLDMTSGLDWKEPLSAEEPETMLQMVRSRDWGQFVLQRPLVHAPGSTFNYNSGTWQLLADLLQQRTGMTAEAYAARHLFEPLGIRQWRWRQAPVGRATGGWGLYLHTRDMARLALLYARGGQWQGRQVVPREWVARLATAKVPMTPSPGPLWRYADGWWTLPEAGAWLAVGFHRQLVVALPRDGVAAAFTGRHHYPLEELVERLRAAVKTEGALPADADGQAELAREVAAASVEPIGRSAGASPLADAIAGRTWTFERNPAGAREFVLRWQPTPVLEVTWSRPGSTEASRIPYALGLDGRFAPGGTELDPVLSRAHWADDRTLVLQQRFLRDGNDAELTVRFEGDQAEAEYAHSQGWRVRLNANAGPAQPRQ